MTSTSWWRSPRGALAEGLNPRQTLAQDTGAAPDSVTRWVGEARKRGYLEPAEPGRVFARAVTDQGANIRG